MFTKQLAQLEYSDIKYLINTQEEREGYHLDFKKEISKNHEKAKKELAKDISAFANSGGGYLIIGINNDYEIIGVERTIQNKPIDEWLNQILSTNIEPQVFYFDPKIIEIPGSDLVLLVMQIPESTRKPHIVTESNNYYIRINDSCKPANHNQIRDMFEFSRNRTDEFNDFLRKRNLLDENHPDFGLNANSIRLSSEIPESTSYPKPIILISLIPKYPNEPKFDMSDISFINWLDKNAQGYPPAPQFSIFSVHQAYDTKLDGIVLQHDSNSGLVSYFEILENGFVETGLSETLTFPYTAKNTGQKSVALYLTSLIGYEMQILGFAKRLYEHMKYYDEILLQISFVNVLNFNLYGFNQKYDSLRSNRRDEITNKHHKNFKLNFRFNPNIVTDADILSIAKMHSSKICRAFGFLQDLCFVEDQINLNSYYQNRPW